MFDMAASTSSASVNCYHCDSPDVRFAGHNNNGRPGFKCLSCQREFVDPAARVKGNELPPAGNMILKLRAVAESMGRTPAAVDINRLSNEGRCYKLSEYLKVFGSYGKAVKTAGLQPNYARRFDVREKEMMLFELRELSRKWRRPLTTDDVREARRQKLIQPFSRYQKAFGGLAAAVAAAGVGIKTFWSDEEMIALLRRVDLTLDRPIRQSDLNELYRQGKAPSPKVLAARFGGMAKAREAAGIKDKYRFANGVTGSKQKYSRERLVEQLQALVKRLGREPTYRDIMASPRTEVASPLTFTSMFGSMHAAYEAAGFKPKFKVFSRKEIVAALRRLKRKLGHYPSRREITLANKAGEGPSHECIRNRLGNRSDIQDWI